MNLKQARTELRSLGFTVGRDMKSVTDVINGVYVQSTARKDLHTPTYGFETTPSMVDSIPKDATVHLLTSNSQIIRFCWVEKPD